MYVLVYMYTVFTVVAGIIYLTTLFINSFLHRKVQLLSCDVGENELEYKLRLALIKYPDSVIEAPDSKITAFLQRYTDRIIIHQEM